MTALPARRSARLAGVLGGLICGTLAAVGLAYLVANQAGGSLRVLFRPVLWFFLAGGAGGYAIERWALAKPAVGRIVSIAFVIISPVAIYRLMLMYGFVMAAGVVAILAVTISLVLVFTKEA
jgi:hypothetical protein